MKNISLITWFAGSLLAVAACTPATKPADKGDGAATKAVASQTAGAPGADAGGSEDAHMNLQIQIDQHFSEYKRADRILRPEFRMAIHPALAAKIERRQKSSDAADPFCNCQQWDPAAFTYRITQIALSGSEKASATVEVQPGADKTKRSTIDMELVPGQGGRWDVIAVGELKPAT